MAVTLSQKVIKLLTDLGEDIEKFKRSAWEVLKMPGASYVKVKLNKVSYYMHARKQGADYEVYDYSFDEPKLR